MIIKAEAPRVTRRTVAEVAIVIEMKKKMIATTRVEKIKITVIKTSIEAVINTDIETITKIINVIGIGAQNTKVITLERIEIENTEMITEKAENIKRNTSATRLAGLTRRKDTGTYFTLFSCFFFPLCANDIFIIR